MATSVPHAAPPAPVDMLLRPGEYGVGDATHRMRTVLGSCVSMTLWCPVLRIGAMSHFLLAHRVGRLADALDARYGDEALALMLRDLELRRVRPQQCEAKIFGGGDMFPAARARATVAVGRRNGEAARSLLLARGITVVSESLFGDGHRQIVFDVASGNVWSRQIPPQSEAARPAAGPAS